MSQWREETVLGVHKSSKTQEVRTQEIGNSAREAGFDRHAAIFSNRCVVLGEWSGNRELELSLGIGDLSRVWQAGERVGVVSGTQ